MKLSKKQELFCIEYTVDLNATQAAIRAGYSKKCARQVGANNMAKVYISQKVIELMSTRMTKAKVNSEYVLNRLIEIDSLDVLDLLDEDGYLKPVKEWTRGWRTSISALDISELMNKETKLSTVLKKVKFPDKLRNLELLGKHINIKAWEKDTDAPTIKEPLQITVIRATKPKK